MTGNHNRCKIRLDHALHARFTHNLGRVDLGSPAPIFPKLSACRGLGLVTGSKRITEGTVKVDWTRSSGGATSGSCKRTRNTARNTSQFSAIRRKIPFFHDVVGKNSLLRHGLRCANSMQFSGTIRTDSHKRKTRIKRLADRGVQMRHRTSRGRNDAGASRGGTVPLPQSKSKGKKRSRTFIQANVHADWALTQSLIPRKRIGEGRVSRSGAVHKIANSTGNQGINDALSQSL